MKINQVEELVGITKKNIRFYEEQGLLNPQRNPENGYREYGLADVEVLYKVKLLRKLAVPIEEIKALLEERQRLDICMENHLVHLNHEQQNLEIMKKLCTELMEQPTAFSELAATDYLERMEQLERDGTQFMDIEKRDVRKKKRGSIIAALAVVGTMIATIGLFLWGMSLSPLPLGVAAVVVVTCILPIIGVAVALVQRLKEIDGGEEDEARKY